MTTYTFQFRDDNNVSVDWSKMPSDLPVGTIRVFRGEAKAIQADVYKDGAYCWAVVSVTGAMTICEVDDTGRVEFESASWRIRGPSSHQISVMNHPAEALMLAALGDGSVTGVHSLEFLYFLLRFFIATRPLIKKFLAQYFETWVKEIGLAPDPSE